MDIIRFSATAPATSVKPPVQTPDATAADAAPVARAASDHIKVAGTYTVRHADSLWGIADKQLGDSNRWADIFDLNKDKVKNPDLIFPGTILKMPAARPHPATPEHEHSHADKPHEHHDTGKPHGGQATHPAKPAEPAHGKPAASDPKPSSKPSEPAAKPTDPAPEPKYPTVGEYVHQRFDNAVDTAVTGLHGAAEIALPPLLLGEIAAIKAQHRSNALKRIWDLPMDPQGKWKQVAAKISDEESAKANAEIKALPGVRVFSAAGDAIGDGLTWTGHQIEAGANAVVDGAVSAGVAVGKGVSWVGGQIEDGARATGRGLKAAGSAVVDGVSWVGTQAVEAPKAAARGAVRGIGSVGEGLVKFSRWALGGLGN